MNKAWTGAAAVSVVLFVGAVGCGPTGAVCDFSNCSGCCSAVGVCLFGDSTSSCGAGGNLCDSCVSGQSCSSGRCVSSGSGGGSGTGGGAGTGGGSATGGGTGTNSCTSSSACTSSTDICYRGACSSGFGRVYKINFNSATAPSNDNGSAWDLGGGAPDLKACVAVDGTFVGCTREISDVFTASWNESVQVTVTSTSVISVSLYDIDATSDDYVEGFEWPNGTSFIGVARQGGLTGPPYTGAKVSWNISISPL